MADEVVQETVVTEAPSPAPEAPAAEPVAEVAPAPEAVASQEPPKEAPATQETTQQTTQEEPPGSRYEKSLERLMAQARDTRRKQQEEAQQRQAAEFAAKIQQAAQYGPDAVMKALGMEQKKLDLSELLGEDDDGTPPTVKELKSKVAKLEEFIQQNQQTEAQKAEAQRQAQIQQWEAAEVSKIEQFLDTTKDKYEFTSQLKEIGSQRDIYNGIISMYQAGYTPSYEDMAELVETRIEDILERLAPTKKFQQWAAKRLQAQSAKPPAPSAPTLKGTLNADSVAQVPPDAESDEENRQRALQAAYAAREAALKAIKERQQG